MTETTRTPQGRILVVEDNRTQAEYLRYILEKAGYSVIVASNGREALGEVKNNPPSLILTDVMMPEMDGYELCTEIKRNNDTADIPVILVTHLFDPVDVIRGLESGADNFIIKPYTPECIHSRIRNILQAEKEPGSDDKPAPLHVVFSDRSHTITATRLQIVNILLSTYEVAVKNNADLQIAHEQLHYLNDQMQKTLSDLQDTNQQLSEENHERQLVEAALANANKKLQLMASITRHDLLNQLNSLQGYLELAEAEKTDNPELVWTYIGKTADILKQTVKTIKFTGEYQDIGIKSPVWQKCRTIVSRSVQHTSLHHVTLINTIPENIEIYADPLIEKVFSNLIENSVRYGDTISAITLRYEEQNGNKKIIFEDDGVGIPAREKEMVFQYRYGRNTGQGLFLSREILAITGISIIETGTYEKGARFEILCPDGTLRYSDLDI